MLFDGLEFFHCSCCAACTADSQHVHQQEPLQEPANEPGLACRTLLNPISWRCYMQVVHHGGAGTTHATLAAGKPALVRAGPCSAAPARLLLPSLDVDCRRAEEGTLERQNFRQQTLSCLLTKAAEWLCAGAALRAHERPVILGGPGVAPRPGPALVSALEGQLAPSTSCWQHLCACPALVHMPLAPPLCGLPCSRPMPLCYSCELPAPMCSPRSCLAPHPMQVPCA